MSGIFDPNIFDTAIFDTGITVLPKIVIISRMLPIKRIFFKWKLPLLGNKSFDFKEEEQITGDRSLSLSIPIKTLGNLTIKFQEKIRLPGDFSVDYSEWFPVIGTLLRKYELKILLVGNLRFPQQQEIKARGKRDLKRLLFEVLDEEE